MSADAVLRVSESSPPCLPSWGGGNAKGLTHSPERVGGATVGGGGGWHCSLPPWASW